jgi:protein tyrosine phosphatase (PTP) superfamily phosphohydrolase (DUF442 family)
MAMPEVSPPRRRLRRCLRLLALVAALWLGWEIWSIFGGGNFHCILPGRIYRGAQPSAAALDAIVRQYGIRTVVNLRGCCAPDPWYMEEARVSRDRGVNLEDITFSAGRLPSKNEMRLLVDVLDRSEPPLFFHCRQGADRTGLACATALLLQPDVPYAEARRQLGLRYAHVPIGMTWRLDAVFDLYEQWLSATGQDHSPSAFRHWVAEEYRGGWCQAKIEKVERLGPARAGQPLGYRLHVRNIGPTTWHVVPGGAAGIHVACKLTDTKGFDVYEGRGGLMATEVAPGEVWQAVAVLPLPRPGRYRLLLDLVEEGHCWFFQTGSEPWEEELVVDE